MRQLHHTSQLPLAVAPAPHYSKTFKVTAGLFLVITVAALAKIFSVWGHDYLLKAQNSLCDSLWLNENRVTP